MGWKEDQHGDPDQYFDQRLKCYVLGVQYDVPRRFGRLLIGWDGCCDMSGCISLFEAIDPKVKAIETVSSGRRDTCYLLRDGEWIALEPAETS